MSLFGTKISIVAPVTGTIKDITEVQDITFSQKLLGDGIAIDPENGHIVAPVAGTITQVFHTKHAISIDAKGVQILLHIGMDTVNLKGNGFTVLVKEGDKVKPGEKLLEVDMDFIKEFGYPTETALVIVNSDECKSIEKHFGHAVAGKDEILVVKK